MATLDQVEASQRILNVTLIPITIGWSIQFCLFGVSVDRAIRLLRKGHDQVLNTSAVPGTRYFLIAATFTNACYTVVNFWDIIAWMTYMNRTEYGMTQVLLPDLIGPTLGGLVGVIVPIFMSWRCWKILNRSILCGAVLFVLNLAVLAGLIWNVVVYARYYMHIGSPEELFVPNQFWLFASAGLDILIAVCLTVHLKKLKRGFNPATDSFLDGLVRLAFETSLPPAFVSTLAAIIYACTWKSNFGWNAYYCAVPYIPSLFLLSLVSCIQGMNRRSLAISHSSGPPMSGLNPHTGISGQAKSDRNGRLPLGHTPWQAPIDWHSTLESRHASDEVDVSNEPRPFESFTHSHTPIATPKKLASVPDRRSGNYVQSSSVQYVVDIVENYDLEKNS